MLTEHAEIRVLLKAYLEIPTVGWEDGIRKVIACADWCLPHKESISIAHVHIIRKTLTIVAAEVERGGLSKAYMGLEAGKAVRQGFYTRQETPSCWYNTGH